MDSRSFSVGYVKYDQAKGEEIFLSVTPGFEHGPGIQRDGVAPPHMTDPHSVAYVCNARGVKRRSRRRHLIKAHEQRAGTWTVYNHLKRFHDTLGKQGWRVVGVQGHGDLTMNYWHVAYCDQSEFGLEPKFCRLDTTEDGQAIEPYQDRTYRCLIKWKDRANRPSKLEFHNVHFLTAGKGAGVTVLLADENDEDVTDKVSLAMAGKTIIENRIELPLDAIVDRYDDVRHIFALPEIAARAVYEGKDIRKAIFGEYALFNFLNVRRAALHAPVIIPLSPAGTLFFRLSKVLNTLKDRKFRRTSSQSEIPTLRGQYREYPGQKSIDIFFPRNVYPFGVIGTPVPPSETQSSTEIVCLSSGGLSGRIGNTLEGITRIMYDFLACGEAMVLDEGLDVFQLVNTTDEETGLPKYTNEELLGAVARETSELLATEQAEYGGSLTKMPLNQPVLSEVTNSPFKSKGPSPDEIFPVGLQRSQIRAVLIFARKIAS